MKDKDQQIIDRIIQRIESTMEYCKEESFESFNARSMLQEACVFNLLQIGELANHLSEELISTYASIPWRQIIAMRNRLVHDYDGIRLTIVWETIKDDFPTLCVCQSKSIAKGRPKSQHLSTWGVTNRRPFVDIQALLCGALLLTAVKPQC